MNVNNKNITDNDLFGDKGTQVLPRLANHALIFFTAGLVIDMVFYIYNSQLGLVLANALGIVLFATSGVLYRLQKISADSAIIFQVVVISANLCFSTIREGIFTDSYSGETILVNMCIFIIPTIMSSVTSCRRLPIVLMICGLGSYAVATFLMDDIAMIHFIPILILIFIGAPVVLVRVINAARAIERENAEVIHEKSRLMKLLELDPEHLELIMGRNVGEVDIRALLDSMDERIKENITLRVRDHLRSEESVRGSLKRAYPGLTASELEICCLVARGSTVSEICGIRHVSPSTVTSVRSRLRKKMRLAHGESLKTHLLSVINEYSSDSLM